MEKEQLIKKLKESYSSLQDKNISLESINKLKLIFQKIPEDYLTDLKEANIPFLSSMAEVRLKEKNIEKVSIPAIKPDKRSEGEKNIKEDIKIEKKPIEQNNQIVLNKEQKESKYNYILDTYKKLKNISEQESTKVISQPVEKSEVKKENDKESKLASKDQQIETLKGQISLLKQKLENEKNKAVKPEPNPQTGEVPLSLGLAQKLLKDKEVKKEEVHPHAREMAKDGVSAEKIKKMHPEITADELKKITEDNLNEKIADSIIKDLQKAYGDLKGKTISPEMAKKISKHLDQSTYDLDTLRQLQKANIPFISTLARNKIYKKTGKFEDRRLYVESLSALKDKADKTGMPYNILKQVYDRGMAAWKSGHRPGAGQHQWALARVNSFVTKSSGTWGGADKDLAAKVKGSK
jgi:hypothetical protein